MSCIWAWDWGVNLPYSVYRDSAPDWVVGGVSSAFSVVTDFNGVGLVSPASPFTPGETRCLRSVGTAINQCSLTGPSFGNTDEGWVSTRLRCSNVSTNTITFSLMNGASSIIELRTSALGTSQIALWVNNALVGTSSGVYLGTGSTHVVAINFNMTGANPVVGLWVDGVEEIPPTVATGSSIAINRVRWSSSTASGTIFGLTCIFDDLLDDGANPNYWAGILRPNSVIDSDASWSIFGGSPTKHQAINDQNLATGVETSTDPDTIGMGYQSTTDILAGWTPVDIIHVAAVMNARSDVLNNVSIDIQDGVGLAGSSSDLLTGISQITSVHTHQSSIGPWTTPLVNAILTEYTVQT